MIESFTKGGAVKDPGAAAGGAAKGIDFGKGVDLATLMQLGQTVMAAHNAMGGGGGGGGGGAGGSAMITGMLSQMGVNSSVAGLAGGLLVRACPFGTIVYFAYLHRHVVARLCVPRAYTYRTWKLHRLCTIAKPPCW
jgi:hypothetical protein